MTARNLTGSRKGRQDRPKKPHPDYPLFPHLSGQWAKKVKGKLYYFGRWEEPDTALANYKANLVTILATGAKRVHPGTPDRLTLRQGCNQFLDAKWAMVEAGEISQRHHGDLKRAGELLVKHFGAVRHIDSLRSGDFKTLRDRMGRKWGASSLVREIANVKQIFRWLYTNEYIDRPVRFGSAFKPPSKKTQRLARAAAGSRLIPPDELRKVITAAPPQLKAMILLALNTGAGNADCAWLEHRHLDLDAGWIDYPRRKTGVPRRAKLWRETVEALREAIEVRPKPRVESHEQLVFITRKRQPWMNEATNASPISREFHKVLKSLSLYESGRSFYGLRHIYRTVADETLDQPCVNYTMGHADDSMAAVYRQSISAERLERVADHVRTWLYGEEATP
ncbi:MAG: tyrosine-type recombinase/integrase [Pirellulaceae bacterium]